MEKEREEAKIFPPAGDCLCPVHISWPLTFHCAPTNLQLPLSAILCLRTYLHNRGNLLYQ